MKKKINKNRLEMLINLENYLMMDNRGVLFTISKLKYNREKHIPKKTWFRKDPKEETIYYLTNVEVNAYNSRGRFLGVLDEYTSIDFVLYNDLYNYRENFIDLKNTLSAFGFEITKIDN